MKLSEWVSAVGGQTSASRLLSVTPEAVNKWLRQGHVPRPDTIVQIGKLSRGKVTFNQIVQECASVSKKVGRR